MALSAAEKQRNYRKRRDADPERRAKYLQKRSEKYIEDLQVGKRTHVGNLSERAKRSMRRKWRNEKRKTRARQKQLSNLVTPPQSPIPQPDVPTQGPSQSKGKSKSKKKIAKCYRNLALKNAEIKKLKTKINMYKKRLSRAKSKSKVRNEDTPNKKSRNIMASKKNVRKTLVFHHTLLAQLKADKKQGEKYMENLLTGKILKKYGLKVKFMKEIGIWDKRKRKDQRGTLASRLKKRVLDFLSRGDNSRMLSGKKSTITKKGVKKQKRLLCDSMQNLYRKFSSEHKEVNMSYTLFCRLRPFWIVFPSEKDRETCLCKLCENTHFLVTAMRKEGLLKTSSLEELASSVVCNIENKDCMYSQCKMCKNKKVSECTTISNKTGNVNHDQELVEVTWIQWKTIKEKRKFQTGEEKEITIVQKVHEKGDIPKLEDMMNKHMRTYCKHLFNIKNQFKYFKTLKESLSQNECLLHIDFAENYVGKTSSEIQSMHFGASQPQMTLHTGVYYVGGQEENLTAKTFCTLSNSLAHGPSAIWEYIRPVLRNIKEQYPSIDHLHFFSDGPVTQYRQKGNFYLLSTEIFEEDFKSATWNFLEAGHGKGSPDAVGGSLKRTADRLVRYGTDIMNAEKFMEELQDTKTDVKLYVVHPDVVNAAEDKINLIKKSLKTVPNTMGIHQIQTDRLGHLRSREVSCLCRYGKECKSHKFVDFSFDINNKSEQKDKPKGRKGRKRPAKVKTGERKQVSKKPKLGKGEKTESDNNVKDEVECLPTTVNLSNETDLSDKTGCLDDKSVLHFDKYGQILQEMQRCKSFDDLKSFCETLDLVEIEGKRRNILESRLSVDQIALDLLPADLPGTESLFPVLVKADGDCLPSTGSVFAFSCTERVEEIRVRIIVELTLNKHLYLNNEYLKQGTDLVSQKDDLLKAFCMYSDEYVPGVAISDNTITKIFESEIMKITRPKTYMGIWQMFSLASVLKMPLFSAYPCLGNSIVRRHLHRIILPRIKAKEEIAVILWSSTRQDMVEQHWVPNHFVPVLPVDCLNIVTVESEDSDYQVKSGKCMERNDDGVSKNETNEASDDQIQSEKCVETDADGVSKNETNKASDDQIQSEKCVETDADGVSKNETNEASDDQIQSQKYMETDADEVSKNGTNEASAEIVHENTKSVSESDENAVIDETGEQVQKLDIQEGKYVIVMYDDEPFPGVIKKVNFTEKEVYVECMKIESKRSEILFCWPKRKDRCWYTFSNIRCMIPPPIHISGSFYSVNNWQKLVSL